MPLDRDRSGSAPDGPAAASDDPTLGSAAAPPPLVPIFPDTAEQAHLVLYPTEHGAFDLRWHLDAAALASARDAFGKGADAPSPVLRLRQVDRDGGASRIIAETPLADGPLAAVGQARCDAGDVAGLLQAEIGLTAAGGGWVLVARSNRLQATGLVGAAFLREPVSASAAAATAGGPHPTPGLPTSAVASAVPVPVPVPAVPPVDFLPTVPVSGNADADAGVIGDAEPMPPETGRPAPLPGPMQAPISRPSSGPISDRDAPAADGADPGDDRSGAARPEIETETGTEAETETNTGTESKAETKTDSETASETESRPESGADSGPVPGSGPVYAFRSERGSLIQAELLVQGQATPGTLLDLGGHPYRVGAGGRFAFRMPLTDRDLLMQLLAALPELPVQSRAAEDEPGGPRR